MAIKVLHLLQKTHPKAKLCMIGAIKDESYAACVKLIQELNMDSSVEFTGLLSPNEWRMKSEKYDLFINTTNFDNTPVSVMEAMALGLPVISTNVGGLPYLISNKKDGVLVDEKDENQMVMVICELLKNKINAAEIAKNARNKVEQFDWFIVKEQWHNIFADV